MENEKEEKQENKDVMTCVKQLVETELTEMLNVGIQQDNIDDIGKLVDIHKDIENEEYWKIKKEVYHNELR